MLVFVALMKRTVAVLAPIPVTSSSLSSHEAAKIMIGISAASVRER